MEAGGRGRVERDRKLCLSIQEVTKTTEPEPHGHRGGFKQYLLTVQLRRHLH